MVGIRYLVLVYVNTYAYLVKGDMGEVVGNKQGLVKPTRGSNSIHQWRSIELRSESR